MSDDADRSQDNQELEDKIRKKYTKRPALEVEPIGSCLNCGEDVGFGMRWCDKDCQDDWAKRQR